MNPGAEEQLLSRGNKLDCIVSAIALEQNHDILCMHHLGNLSLLSQQFAENQTMFNSKAQLLRHGNQIYVIQFNLKKQCLELFSVCVSRTGKISYALLRSTGVVVDKRIESV